MSIERGGNIGFGLGLDWQGGFEPKAAMLTDSKEIRGYFHDAELALCHDSSLPL
jgi:hypothetical protein